MLVLTWSIAAASVILLVWAAIRAVRDRPVIVAQLGAGAVIVVLILAQMVTAGVLQATGAQSVDGWLLWGYLITALLLLPAAGWWALMDTSRWSSVVLVVATFTVAIMQLRVWQIWVTA